MKKNGAAYRLFDGQMYPLACCSWMNSSSAFCSSCVSWYTFPGMDDGTPGFNLIAWSQIHGSRNLWDASSLNTDRWRWYLVGIFPSPICDPACLASLEAIICFLLDRAGKDTQVMCMESVGCDIGRGNFLLPLGVTVHCPMRDSRAYLVCRISGS